MARRTRSAIDDDAGDLVAEHERLLDDEVADPPVLVVVDVRPAHPDGANLDQHVSFPELRERARLESNVARPV
jgi:hypothetical protein